MNFNKLLLIQFFKLKNFYSIFFNSLFFSLQSLNHWVTSEIKYFHFTMLFRYTLAKTLEVKIQVTQYPEISPTKHLAKPILVVKQLAKSHCFIREKIQLCFSVQTKMLILFQEIVLKTTERQNTEHT